MSAYEFWSLMIGSIALTISLGHAFLSIYSHRIDRPRLRVRSRYIPPHPDEWADAQIYIDVVNRGKRAIDIKMSVLAGKNGKFVGTDHGVGGGRLRLEPMQGFDIRYEKGHLEDAQGIHQVRATDFWILDVNDRKYRPKGIRRHLRKLWES